MSADGMLPNDEHEVHLPVLRPTKRSECLSGGWNEQRPCPFASCKYSLLSDVTPTGRVIEVFEGVDIHELPDTCALDAASKGGLDLQDVGDRINVTRERVRQMAERAFDRVEKGLKQAALDTPGIGTERIERSHVYSSETLKCKRCNREVPRKFRSALKYCPACAEVVRREHNRARARRDLGPRDRILALFAGEQAPLELTIADAGKLAEVSYERTRRAIRHLRVSGALAVRRPRKPDTDEALPMLLSLPGKVPGAALETPQRIRRPHNALTPAWMPSEERIDKTLTLIDERGRACADDLKQALPCAASTAWNLLTMLKTDGVLEQQWELSADGTRRRYYRRVKAPSPEQVPA